MPTPTLPACVCCGRACIPLADYDVPVCVRCDDQADTAVALVNIVDAITAHRERTAA